MRDQQDALSGLGRFLERAESDLRLLPPHEYRVAEQVYDIIYDDRKDLWGDFLREQYNDWEDLQDYLPIEVLDAIVLWGIIR